MITVSRLDSFIRRVTSQRDCLNLAAHLVGEQPGLVLELGLGNGRTYDHLRELFPAREILVFERIMAAHPDCQPDPSHLILGNIRETLPEARARWKHQVVLAHADLGSGNPEVDSALAEFVSATLPHFMLPGGVVLSDQELSADDLTPLPLPPTVEPGRYYMFQTGP